MPCQETPRVHLTGAQYERARRFYNVMMCLAILPKSIRVSSVI